MIKLPAKIEILLGEIPCIILDFPVEDFDIDKSEKQCKEKIRELFMKNAHVKDVRIIDMLVIKVN